jgi:hypothetical protein
MYQELKKMAYLEVFSEESVEEIQQYICKTISENMLPEDSPSYLANIYSSITVHDLELKDGSILHANVLFVAKFKRVSPIPHIDAIRVRIKILKVRLYDESSQSRAKEEVANEEKSYLLKIAKNKLRAELKNHDIDLSVLK